MTARTWLFDALLVVAALVLQQTVVARLPLPGSPPDLLLVVVLALALAQGARPGLVVGFSAGCLADLSADHALGRLALAYVVAALVVDRLAGPARAALRVVAAVLAAAAAGLAAYALEGAVLSDPRANLSSLADGLVSSAPYAAALAALVVPVVAGASRLSAGREEW